jgi:hypothetical protein
VEEDLVNKAQLLLVDQVVVEVDQLQDQVHMDLQEQELLDKEVQAEQVIQMVEVAVVELELLVLMLADLEMVQAVELEVQDFIIL